jgi:peptide deformylase
MAVRDILKYPDPRLQEQSAAVDVFDEALQGIVNDLVETLHAHQSIGLSAPQIDVRQQILVMDHSGNQSGPECYINPSILKRGRYGLVEEHCLSVPDIGVQVLRATEVTVQARDTAGNVFERNLSGMPAVCLQHEMDHFEGKLLVDRMNWFRRRRLRAGLG